MIFNKSPLITCVMVTNGRFDLILKSLNCYFNQTYKNKNIVILSQGTEDVNQRLHKYLDHLNRTDILFISAPINLSLGTMRNTSVELATGEIICQWDDDDLYHPDRLLSQYKVLRSHSDCLASIYTQFLKYFKNDAELYWCDWSGEANPVSRYLCGSIMFYKKAFHMFSMFYPENGSQSKVEEDLNVLEKLVCKGVVLPVNYGHEYIYVFHGQNIYDLDHHKLTLQVHSGKKIMRIEDLMNKKKLLEATFKSVGLNESVSVRSLEGSAFVYGVNNEV